MLWCRAIVDDVDDYLTPEQSVLSSIMICVGLTLSSQRVDKLSRNFSLFDDALLLSSPPLYQSLLNA